MLSSLNLNKSSIHSKTSTSQRSIETRGKVSDDQVNKNGKTFSDSSS
jgi:hypothetical protein